MASTKAYHLQPRCQITVDLSLQVMIKIKFLFRENKCDFYFQKPINALYNSLLIFLHSGM